MKKELDCKVIEDLMLPYLDGTLNLETKEIMDKHFSECEECRKKLDEMKSSVLENDVNDKKCIDFLKKARRKERLRVVKFILLIALIVFLIVYLRNFVILNGIYSAREKYLSSDNVYIEKIHHLPNDTASITKYYYKDGKCKIIFSDYADGNISITNTNFSSYSKFEYLLNSLEEFALPYNSSIFSMLFNNFLMSVSHPLKSDNLYMGSDIGFIKSYVFKFMGNHEVWYDRETGLLSKIVYHNLQPLYYDNTFILKATRDNVTEYKYQFDVVSDEDVIEPVINNDID